LTSFDDETEPPLATRGGDGGGPREQARPAQAPSAQDPSARDPAVQAPSMKAPSAQAPAARVPPARPGPEQGGRWRAWRAQAVTTVRHHWLVSALLVAGLVLRVLTQIGYRPALLYVDSLKYLYGASPGSDPLGYRLILKVILVVGDLGTVAAIQHLLGLAMAVALYLVLLRRGVPVWLSALAVAPVLLDAYQLQMEQTIMPDVWFEALIVAGLVVLLWRPVLTPRFAIAAGLILGASATVKALGEFLVLPALVHLLAAGGGMRRNVRVSAALVAAFALPILAYCSINYARTGHFWLARQQTLTGRLAAAADCSTLKLPEQARPLCPTPAEQQALGPDGLEHLWGLSPLYATHVPLGTRGALISDIKHAVVHQQPGRVAVSILSDSLRLFAPTRQATPWVTPIARWQFQAGYPTYPAWTNICPDEQLSPHACLNQQVALRKKVAPVTNLLIRPGGTLIVGVQKTGGGVFNPVVLGPSYSGRAQVNRPVAAFLRSYQLNGGYTPGPLLALAALAGVAGSVLALVRRSGDARRRQLALGCLLFTGTAAVVLLIPDVYEFSWRYALPAVITLVPAGVLGCWAFLAGRGRRANFGQHLFGASRPRPHPSGDAPDQ
jgi:hypothetical protein